MLKLLRILKRFPAFLVLLAWNPQNSLHLKWEVYLGIEERENKDYKKCKQHEWNLLLIIMKFLRNDFDGLTKLFLNFFYN